MVAHPPKPGLFVLLFLLATILLAPLSASAQQFVTVDYPGATATVVFGINNTGQMVGAFTDSEGLTHGFSLISGTFAQIDFTGATYTQASDINDVGQIVGTYVDAENIPHGFVLANSVFTSITDPAYNCATCATEINAITDTGEIIGGALDANGVFHGFQDVNGVFTTLDFPGAIYTALSGIPFLNGDIVGSYSLSGGPDQGLVYSDGQFTTFNVTGASTTDLYGINDAGEVLGSYSLPTGTGHVFLTTCTNQSGTPVCSQTLTNIDFPGGLTTIPSNLNDGGQVVGGYIDSNNVTHGYLMTTGPFAYVANGQSASVSVIDTSTALTVASIPVGASPFFTAIAPNGTQVYVTNSASGTVSVISTASNTVIATIPVQSGPSGLAFTPDGTEVYVANFASHSVSVINTASQTVVATIQVQSDPFGVAMALTSNGTFAYVTNYGSNTVSVIAQATNTVVQTINVGTTPYGVAVTPNSSLVYVENNGSGTVSVISVASNTVTATIPTASNPAIAAFTPDSSTAYVTNFSSNTVSVIDTTSNSVIGTVQGLDSPLGVALTTDGAFAYVVNTSNNTVSVITTSTNTITGTVPVGTSPQGIAIASNPPSTLKITEPLSPTQPNVFNFGTNSQTVQYPAGTTFTNVNMTTEAVQITPAQFAARVAGTQFASAICIVYSGTGGNCVDYEVTCTDNNNNPITCPTESAPTIAVQTAYSSSQAITNPGYLTTPIGLNEWTNIFTGFTDPITKGKTTGFSEFVAVDLGSTNAQGMARLRLLSPTLPTVFCSPSTIPLQIYLTSVVNGSPVTDAQASVSALLIANAAGNPTQDTILSVTNAFRQTAPGHYIYDAKSNKFPAGSYILTIYGNAFPAFQAHFQIELSGGSGCNHRILSDEVE